VKLHLLLDHDGYLPVYAHLSEGRVHEMVVAKSLNFSKGTVVVMDRGYIDYKLFARWTKAGIFFVTRLKENANYWDLEDRPLPKSEVRLLTSPLR
jgi:Transposase DDE domain